LFLDMQMMVEMQQEALANIEKSSDNAVYELEEGNKEVTVAVKTAKNIRKVC
jgi:t-SNARE complex subunit (syntaxin)